jgi:hypothetical protein
VTVLAALTIRTAAVDVGLVAIPYAVGAVGASRRADFRAIALGRAARAGQALAIVGASAAIATSTWTNTAAAVALAAGFAAAAGRASALTVATRVSVPTLVVGGANAPIDAGTKATAHGARRTKLIRVQWLVMNDRRLVANQRAREKSADVAARHFGGQRDGGLRCHQNAAKGALNRNRRRRSDAEQDVHVTGIDVDQRATECKAVLDVDEDRAGGIVDVEDRLRVDV